MTLGSLQITNLQQAFVLLFHFWTVDSCFLNTYLNTGVVDTILLVVNGLATGVLLSSEMGNLLLAQVRPPPPLLLLLTQGCCWSLACRLRH